MALLSDKFKNQKSSNLALKLHVQDSSLKEEKKSYTFDLSLCKENDVINEIGT